ncbi:MAG: type II toxin-antitoxin system RelE/ParE family toxin [Rhizonema sp. PD38]|nr:type II toxin-antitoxin system RelE/ParE family toxin [Rhizonema sp. PD38]
MLKHPIYVGCELVLFCIREGSMILLHGFIKKTQKTPKKDLNLALERKQQVEAMR